jgi:hypothetical protein
VRRREFITLLSGAAATWPLAAHSQRVPMRRIGMLMAATAGDPEYRTRMAAFQNELALLGLANKAERSAAELVERRAEAKGMRVIKACSGHCAGFSMAHAMGACASSCI